MNDLPETRESLLVQLLDSQNAVAWDEFYAIYRPTIIRVARTRGLQAVDADELAQKVLMKVAESIRQWTNQSERPPFRYWLGRVARNAAINALKRQPVDRADGGTTAFELLASQEDACSEPATQLDLQFRRQMFRKAAEIVRNRADDKTWLAFSLTMIDGLSIAGTAVKLEVSEGSVYAARSRVMRRLKDAVRELQGADND